MRPEVERTHQPELDEDVTFPDQRLLVYFSQYTIDQLAPP